MVAEASDGAVAAPAAEVSQRRAQNIARSRKRARAQNIVGPKKTAQVTMALADYERLQADAAEAGMTVPNYLVQCALHPVGARSGETGKVDGKPWLPWPKRKTLAGILMSA